MKLIADIKELDNRYNSYVYTGIQRKVCESCEKLAGIEVSWKIDKKIINTTWFCNLSCFYSNIWYNKK